MARLLDYISKQIDNIQETIDEQDLLKNQDIYEVTNYLARNPNFVYGNSTPYYNVNEKYANASRISGIYGINVNYWIDIYNISKTKKSGKERFEYFKNKVLQNKGKTDKDIRTLFQRVYTNPLIEKILRAIANKINYNVLNTYSSIANKASSFNKINTNLNYSSLPFGVIAGIVRGDSNKHYVDYTGNFGTTELKELMTALQPKNLTFTDSTVDNNIKFCRTVANKSEGYIRMLYKINKARGFIKNDSTYLDIADEYNCSPLGLGSVTDQSYFNGERTFDIIEENATKITIGKSSKNPEGCSPEEMQKIKDEQLFVSKINENEDFIKINKVTGKGLVDAVSAFSSISRNFSDSGNGLKAITVKFYFDKKKEIFVNVRSNDLFFALTCATFGDKKEDTIDIYYNENTQEAYFVNKNGEQYGTCRGLSSGKISNCENILYGELYQPSLSVQQKAKIFSEDDISPILLSQSMIDENEALEDSLVRQKNLQSIQDSDLFYDLFIKSIAAYVYTYAEQKKNVNGQLVWVNKQNPKWSQDANEGKWFKNPQGKMQWSNPNYFYIYDVRETFWINNQGMDIKEALAFFVSKGGSRNDNSSYYRKLCQRILGVDYYLFSQKLTPILLQEGLLCIEDLDIVKQTGEIKSQSFVYSYDYASGDVYKKMEKLGGDLQENIKTYFGEKVGSIIIDNQYALLDSVKPEPLTFGDKNPALNLVVNIHNPIFYSSDDNYVGRVGRDYGAFRNGKVTLSTIEQTVGEKFKPLEPLGVGKTRIYTKYFEKQNPLNLTRNHLKLFYEWVMFGSGVNSMSKPHLKQNEIYIVDGYIFPMKMADFIEKHLMPTFEKIEDRGENIKAPLEFLPFLTASNKTFTPSNLYLKQQFFGGNLTEESRQNLIKIGLVEKKPKKEVTYQEPDPNNPKQKITTTSKFTPITEDEGKRIYAVITDKYKKLESEIVIEGDNLFTIFCKTQMTPDYRIYIENLWNSRYNNMAIPEYKKFPIFCEHSRWFGEMPTPFLFNLRDAQVEGMKFSVANMNSGLLAHEVGFGKTTTSIAMMSHMMLTGASLRPIVFTPNQVYEKFADEIVGRDTTGVLGLLTNWIHIAEQKEEGLEPKVDIVKFGNASATIMFGTKLVPGLKKYTEDELSIIERWKGKLKPRKGKDTRTEDEKGVFEQAKKQLYNLPTGQPQFFTEDPNVPDIKFTDGRRESRIATQKLESDAYEWLDNFRAYLAEKIPEINESDSTDEAVESVLMKIEKEIDNRYAQIESKIQEMKSGYRYQLQDFQNKDRISTYPQHIQDWWKKNNPAKTKKPLGKFDYPQKGWVTDPKFALEEGVLTQSQYNRIIQEAKQLKRDWEGALSKKGYSLVRQEEQKLANEFFSASERTGKVTRLLKQVENMLIDVLGVYKSEVKEKNRIILCSHEAIKQFRASKEARNEAAKYVQQVDDVAYLNKPTVRFYDNQGGNALSLNKLNIDGICIDEIHNFNNLISKPREHILANVSQKRGGKGNKEFMILPTATSSSKLEFLPDGDAINPQHGVSKDANTPLVNQTDNDKKDVAYRLGYYSTGKGTLANDPGNLIALIFDIQEKVEEINEKNTILMSATPFTDNIFQMFSVFGMANLERMEESNLYTAWDFFVTFAREEWRYNITHKQTFGLFPEIQSYYNSGAMSNYIKAFANFKVSDIEIEKSRPLKYLIPQDGADSGYQAGANSASVKWAPELQNVSSYIELSPIQRQILDKIAEYVEGKIDIPFAYCPNYGEVVKVSEETGEVTYANEDVKDAMDRVGELLSKAKSEEAQSNDWYDLMYEARALLTELRTEYPKDKRIAAKQKQLDRKLFDTDTQKDMEDDTSLYDSNYQDLDLTANTEEQVRSARAIVGQSFGQMCVISPYLLKCDDEASVPNDLLKDYPLYPNDLSKSAENFVEQSPKIKYAIECAINTIKYDSKNPLNLKQVGGQIIYLNRGKNFVYGGNYYNAYKMIQRYIVDRKVEYYNEITEQNEIITEENIGIITGSMSKTVTATNRKGEEKLDEETGRAKKIGIREDIRDKFNDGRIKILLGSSAIKEGIDLNKRAHTLYILDSDFSPSNAMQLEGRIWRQKNMWEFVRIVYVLGRDSIDAFVYSKLQSKINEIKKMLEQGVYELNRTQYTINAKERIRNIISDIDQLTDLAWQDKVDELLEKQAKYASEKTKLITIKNKYPEVKSEFDKYIYGINNLYKVAQDREVRLIADKVKTKIDLERQYDYQLESKGRGREWKEQNVFKPISISQAMSKVKKDIENGDIDVKITDLFLTGTSSMTEVNRAVDIVRKMIRNKSGEIKNILGLGVRARKEIFKDVNENSSFGLIVAKTLLDNIKIEVKGKIKGSENFVFDEVIKYINGFVKGSENETIMSNFDYLIANRTKNEATGEMYGYDDVESLIVKAGNKVSEAEKELGSEKVWKQRRREVEINIQKENQKNRGEDLSSLIENFKRSNALLKIRVKK